MGLLCMKKKVLTKKNLHGVLRHAMTTQSSVVILVATKRTRRYINDIIGKVCFTYIYVINNRFRVGGCVVAMRS